MIMKHVSVENSFHEMCISSSKKIQYLACENLYNIRISV